MTSPNNDDGQNKDGPNKDGQSKKPADSSHHTSTRQEGPGFHAHPLISGAGDGMVRDRAYCTNCSKDFITQLDARLDGAHKITCPFCSHIHYRVVRNGVVTEERRAKPGDMPEFDVPSPPRLEIRRAADRDQHRQRLHPRPLVQAMKKHGYKTHARNARAYLKTRAYLKKGQAMLNPIGAWSGNLWGDAGTAGTCPAGTCTVGTTYSSPFVNTITVTTSGAQAAHVALYTGVGTAGGGGAGAPSTSYPMQGGAALSAIQEPKMPNRHLEASDLLEAFLRHMSAEGVGRAELLELPIELFVSWLIVEAATAEGAEIPDNVLPPRQKLAFVRRPRICRGCETPLPQALLDRGLQWCSPACVGLEFKAAEPPKLLTAA